MGYPVARLDQKYLVITAVDEHCGQVRYFANLDNLVQWTQHYRDASCWIRSFSPPQPMNRPIAQEPQDGQGDQKDELFPPASVLHNRLAPS